MPSAANLVPKAYLNDDGFCSEVTTNMGRPSSFRRVRFFDSSARTGSMLNNIKIKASPARHLVRHQHSPRSMGFSFGRIFHEHTVHEAWQRAQDSSRGDFASAAAGAERRRRGTCALSHLGGTLAFRNAAKLVALAANQNGNRFWSARRRERGNNCMDRVAMVAKREAGDNDGARRHLACHGVG
jgi:hypothetical protein